MTLDNEIARIEQDIEQDKKDIALAQSLERLRLNRDFRKVVEDAYFREEAVRLVRLKADPNMQSAEKQDAIIKEIDAIGRLAQFLHLIEFKAGMANRSLTDSEAMLVELRQEGA